MKLVLEQNQHLYFTSDTHYNHKNICRGVTEWTNAANKTRDFKSLDSMNAAIVDGINSTVGQDDILVHMGDFSFGGFESIIEFRKRIICKNIVLFLGNHDHHIRNNKDGVQEHFTHVSSYDQLEVRRQIKKDLVEKFTFVCCHFPIASWDSMNKGIPHLFGHVHLPKHLKVMKDSKAMDVGMDGNDLKPYSLDEINKIMYKQPVGKLILPADHHMEEIR